MQLTSNEYKIDVECDSEIYRFNSLKECMDYFSDLSKHYLRQLRNQEILFSMILFQKKSDSRIAEVDAYYNGKLYKTFKNMKEASIAFNKSKGSVFSAIKKQRI